jgi:hypothetical protein
MVGVMAHDSATRPLSATPSPEARYLPVQFAVNARERAELAHAARAAGLSASEFIRRAVRAAIAAQSGA